MNKLKEKRCIILNYSFMLIKGIPKLKEIHISNKIIIKENLLTL